MIQPLVEAHVMITVVSPLFSHRYGLFRIHKDNGYEKARVKRKEF